MSNDLHVDVLVVGCGPVGVMAALRGAQRGLRVLAVDKATDVFPLPRAIGMDDETQRLFHTAGLGEQLRDVSTPLRGAEFVDATGRRLVGIDIPDGARGPNGHPPMTMFDQPALERALRAAAIRAGVELRLGTEATCIDQGPDEVRVTLRSPQGDPAAVTAGWVIGADGAASHVRRRCGIEVVDQGFDQRWLVVDTTALDPTCALPAVAQQVCDPERVVSYVPGHDRRRRWEVQLHDHEDPAEVLDEEWIHQVLGRWAAPDQLEVDRKAIYRFHALVAETFRDRRAFLVGDAAHQMPPFNGQGMNSGMRDAENLMWKLAYVRSGLANERLLDTYDAERRPHATGQVAHAADAGRLIDALARGEDLDTESGYGGGRPFPHIEAGLVTGSHPAVGHPLPQPHIDGTPLDELLGSGFAIVRHPDAAGTDGVPPALAWLQPAMVTVDHPALEPLGAPGAATIVRPDRYVSAISTDLDGDARWLHAEVAP